LTDVGAAHEYPAVHPVGNRGYVPDATSTRREYYSRAAVDNGGDAYTMTPVLRGKNGQPYRRIISKAQRLAVETRAAPGRR
jgi:hypothetical protein